jgi:hypothetical protein
MKVWFNAMLIRGIGAIPIFVTATPALVCGVTIGYDNDRDQVTVVSMGTVHWISRR